MRTVGTAANNSSNTPLLPIRRNNVPPEVLATWCTFNEAFGGGRPKQHHRIPAEPLTVNDERNSSGSLVFEDLFLPPPQKFEVAPPPIVVDFIIAWLSHSNISSSTIAAGGGNHRVGAAALVPPPALPLPLPSIIFFRC